MFTPKQMFTIIMLLCIASIIFFEGYKRGHKAAMAKTESWVREYNLEKYKIPREEVRKR